MLWKHAFFKAKSKWTIVSVLTGSLELVIISILLEMKILMHILCSLIFNVEVPHCINVSAFTKCKMVNYGENSLSIQIPNESRDSFPRLLRVLEEDIKSKGKLKIKSFGVSTTTLEDVFISFIYLFTPNPLRNH